ncbi:hypothetical protein GQ457_13G015090 [Hibiscus cannabinus]
MLHSSEYFEDWGFMGARPKTYKAGVSSLSNVFEQPPAHTQFAGSSSYNPASEEVYCPQFQHTQFIFSIWKERDY